jgi:RND family efflux transporter MFP subunit
MKRILVAIVVKVAIVFKVAMVVASVAIVSAAGSAWAQFGGAAPVEVDEARLIAMAPTMQVAGTVLSRSDALLSAEVSGRLLEIAEAGARFEAGDMLARIEDKRLKLQAEELEAEIESVQARLLFLNAELERYQSLVESNLASGTQIDQTRSNRDVAQSDLQIARSRLAQLEDQIDRTRIRAPFDGVVAQRLVQAGERVSEGTQVMRIYNPNDLEVVARAPLNYYRFVQPGDDLAVRANDEVIAAPLRTAVSQGTEQSHVFELRLDLEARLPVGQTVRVTIPTADVREVLAVPRDALVLRGTGTSVFVIDDENNARRVSVAVGIGSENMIEVKGPIQPGDRVVIRGNERLREGQAIEVIRDAGSTESA